PFRPQHALSALSVAASLGRLATQKRPPKIVHPAKQPERRAGESVGSPWRHPHHLEERRSREGAYRIFSASGDGDQGEHLTTETAVLAVRSATLPLYTAEHRMPD